MKSRILTGLNGLIKNPLRKFGLQALKNEIHILPDGNILCPKVMHSWVLFNSCNYFIVGYQPNF